MPRDNRFVAQVLALLAHLGDIRARALFGGHGIYRDGVMFALIANERLYFKTDDETRPRFVKTACKPFAFRNARGTVATSYYEPPVRALKNARSLMAWAELGLIAAHNAAKTKRAKAGRRAAKRVVKSRP